jgi:hypothetical protein
MPSVGATSLSDSEDLIALRVDGERCRCEDARATATECAEEAPNVRNCEQTSSDGYRPALAERARIGRIGRTRAWRRTAKGGG